MPLSIVRNDITKMKVDAIVNAANESLLGGGGVDGCIHRAAGPRLLEECRTLNGCRTGQAKITGAYDLPAKYVIHTVGPIWRGGALGEEQLLRSCYRTSLELAKKHHCENVAFPLISAGVYGYPKGQALKIAMEEISNFLLDNEMLAYIVIFDKNSVQISEKLFADIKQYIDDNYVDLHSESYSERLRRANYAGDFGTSGLLQETSDYCAAPAETLDSSETPASTPEYSAIPMQAQDMMPTAQKMAPDKVPSAASKTSGVKRLFAPKKTADASQILKKTEAFSKSWQNSSLDSLLDQIDESFSQMLLRKIDEKGMKDSDCYKKANIDRKLFSKIRNDIHYKPKKTTAIAFAIALELPLEEAKELLLKAGYALSHSSKFDIIIEYFISKGIYNIYDINEVLFAFDQVLLGA